MNRELLADVVDEAALHIAKYKFEVILSTQKLMEDQFKIENLEWDSISFDDDTELTKIPDDKRGVYAFAICHESNVLPPHGYILYIGIAGRDSMRSLRARYRDYLNDKKVRKRDNILRIIGTWYEVLRFFFAPVEDDFSSEDLKRLERKLNTALLPPFVEGDIDADTKRMRRAFR